MRVGLFLNFGQPNTGMPGMWGSAAWAQTQLTPGVSVLAAPRSRPVRPCKSRIKEPTQNVARQVERTDFVK
jgi:hypothetical protein